MGLFSLGGSTTKTESFLKTMQKSTDTYSSLERLAQRGVVALQNATPTSTGLTAASWGYIIEKTGSKVTISWTNSNSAGGVPVVILLQYGHGTGTGGYVSGREFINSAIQPIFDDIANEVWKKVTSA